MIGDAALFARQDAVEAVWRSVDPILRLNKPV
jgi:glucose-6-phosphate 1-dehydrogenase